MSNKSVLSSVDLALSQTLRALFPLRLLELTKDNSLVMDSPAPKDYTALLAPFSQISTPRGKQLALEGLMTALSHQEIRGIQNCVKSIHYRKDILSELPIELSQRIAEYLPLPSSIRARRVSRKWLNILASPQTTQCLLRPWQGMGDPDLRISKGLSQRAISSLEAEHICAYRTGTAFDRRTVEARLPRNGPISLNVAYSSGRVAWIDRKTSITHLLTLEDGEDCLPDKVDDEILSHIALSGSMMAVTTLSGQCRVTEIVTRAEHRFQLSPTNVQSIVVAKDTVAILHKPLDGSLQASVTTWTLQGRTTFHFPACLNRSLGQALDEYDLKIMLDTSGTRVIVFERVTEARVVHSTHFDLDGKLQAEGELELPDMEGYTKHSEEGTPTHVNQWATVWSYSKTGEGSSDSSTGIAAMFRVQYHPERGFLRLKRDSYKFYTEHAWPMSNVFFLDDVGYTQASFGSALTLLTVMDLSTSSFDIAAMGQGLDQSWGLRHDLQRQFFNNGGMTQSIFLGDQRFLVNVCQYGFHFWVFDKGHGMDQIDEHYRKEREATGHRLRPWSSSAWLLDR